MKIKTKELKKLWKPFLILFLISFLIINWSQTSWIFNYRVFSGFFSEFFQANKEEKSEVSLNDYFDHNEVDEEEEQYHEKEGSIEIPKINIFAPLVFTESLDEKEIKKSLDLGVVHFFDSVFPGQKGQTIFLGHSAPPGWPKIKYDWVFSDLNDLVEGDEIIVYFNQKKFSYSTTEKLFLEKGEELPDQSLTNSKNVLILVSCWPPGQNIKRIAIVAEKY